MKIINKQFDNIKSCFMFWYKLNRCDKIMGYGVVLLIYSQAS